MTSRALLLLAVPALFVAGGALGYVARRHEEDTELPPPRERPPELRRRLDDYERRSGAGPDICLDGQVIAALSGPATREDLAEAKLLVALRVQGTKALESVDREFPDTHASARAHWETILRLPEGPKRDALLADFRRRHPHAWVLRAEVGR
jgi:hypothetical protein